MTHKQLDSFYRNVTKEIKKIIKASRVIDLKLHKLFSDPLYSFDIEIDGILYQIKYEFESDKSLDQIEVRNIVIKKILKIALEDMIENLHDDAQSFDAFGSILEFSNITAHEDMQVSRDVKITPDNPRYEEIMAELKAKHDQGIGLDENSLLVQFQNTKLYDDEMIQEVDDLLQKESNGSN